MSAYLRSASSALEVLRPMQGHSAPPAATSTTHQLVAEPRKARLSFRKRSTDVEKADQYDWRFATTVRVPRRPRSFAKRVRKWAISKAGHHTSLCGYACSLKKLPRSHPTGAVRHVTTANPLELLSSSPLMMETIARQSSHRFRRAFGCDLGHSHKASSVLWPTH